MVVDFSAAYVGLTGFGRFSGLHFSSAQRDQQDDRHSGYVSIFPESSGDSVSGPYTCTRCFYLLSLLAIPEVMAALM